MSVRSGRKIGGTVVAALVVLLALGVTTSGQGSRFGGRAKEPPKLTEEQLLARGRYGLGVKAYQAQDYRKSIVHLEKAMELDREYSAAATLLALATVEMGDFAQAAPLLTHAVNLAPANQELFMLLVDVHRELKEWGAAMDLLRKAEIRRGRTGEVIFGMAEVALGRRDWPKAEALLLELKRLEPSNLDQRLRLLDLYETSGATERSLQEAKELTELYPRDRSLQLRYVHLLLRAGHEDHAVVELERLARRQPDHVRIREMLVHLYAGPVPNPIRWRFHEARLKELNARGR